MALRRFVGRSEVVLLLVFLVGIALALLLGRWLAVIQEPPTRQGVGQQLLANGRANEAAYLFQDHLWKGAALYRSGRYHRAVGEFVSDDSITGYYNMGNAYAHLGLYEGAIAAYEVVLARVPTHEDARYNLDLVREMAALERALEEETQNTEEAGNWEDGLQQDQQETGTEPDPSADDDDDMPSASETGADEQAGDEQTDTSEAPPASSGASGSEQEGKKAEAESFTLTSGEQRDDTDLSPGTDDLDDRPVAPGKIDRLREEEMADEIVLRRIEDDPALVLKARLSMALRKQESGR